MPRRQQHFKMKLKEPAGESARNSMSGIRNTMKNLIIAAGYVLVLFVSQGLAVENSSPEQNSVAARSGMSEKVSPELEESIKALQSADSYERHRAAIALGRSGSPEAVEPLLGALNDRDTFVRNFACTSLGNLGDPRAVAPLVKALGDESLVVRRSAAEALGNLGDKRPVDPLIKALSDESDLVRRSAAQALGALGDPRAADALLLALRDEDIYIWNGASIALTAIGNACVPDLVKALGDWILGPRAASILRDLGWQPSSDEERILFYVATRNRQALLQNWDIARKILVSEANNGSNRQAENAVCALIGIGREESLEDLAEIIKAKGSTEMAAAFLKSGNTYLAEVARKWANANGGEIKDGSGGGLILWGRLGSF